MSTPRLDPAQCQEPRLAIPRKPSIPVVGRHITLIGVVGAAGSLSLLSGFGAARHSPCVGPAVRQKPLPGTPGTHDPLSLAGRTRVSTHPRNPAPSDCVTLPGASRRPIPGRCRCQAATHFRLRHDRKSCIGRKWALADSRLKLTIKRASNVPP
jgi:hypothetical protein